MRIQKCTEDLLSTQSKIALPILSEELIGKTSDITGNLGIAEILSIQDKFPWFFVELSTQYFYYKLFEKKHPICRMLYFSDMELSFIKPYLQVCFIKLTFSKIKTSVAPYRLWQVKVNGISEWGIEVIKNLPETGELSGLLHRLYIDCIMCGGFEEEGLYQCFIPEKEKHFTLDSALYHLAVNPFQKTIDVTNWDNLKIAQDNTLNKILSFKRGIYINIDTDTFFTPINLKVLCWEKESVLKEAGK